MIHKRIVEAVSHSRSEFFAVFLIQRKNRNDFIKKQLVHESMYGLIVHAVTDDVKTSQISAKDKTGMRTI